MGPARQHFSLLEPEIVEQLNSVFIEQYSSILLFHLYMIGRSVEAASPTIMFFSEEKEARKRAKKALDHGGLLERLPGFRTAHLARQPGVGKLIQPAAGSDDTPQSSDSDMVTEVYFDASYPVKAIGMPIFIKHSDETFRKATANAVFEEDKCVYLSVSHVFFDDISSTPNESVVSDGEYDFGSGTEYEDEDECLNATSRASVSSFGGSLSDWPGSTTSKPSSSMHSPNTSSVVSSPVGDDRFSSMVAVLADSHIGQQPAHIASNQPPRGNLEYLGNMTRHSVKLDWALIEISNARVASTVHNLKASVRKEDNDLNPGTDKEPDNVVAHTSRGPIVGQLSRETVFMRLPNSTSFQKVHQIMLDSALEWGDCGVGISDAATKEPYGHVVATSATKEIAYLVPAQEVFRTSGTQWAADLEAISVSPRLSEIQGL